MWPRLIFGVVLSCLCMFGCRPTAALAVAESNVQDNDINDKDSPSVPPKLSVWATNCDTSSCATFYKSIGYISGDCNGNYCICKVHRKDPREKNNGIDEPLEFDECNPTQCDQNCRRIGFNGGACVGNKCKCDILQPDDTDISGPRNSLTNCDWASCNSCCRSIGFITGYCLYGNCMCVHPQPKNKRQHTESRTHALSTVRASITFGKCSQNVCSKVCHRLGYDEQQCYDDKCECTHSQKEFDKIEGNEKSCNGLQCDQLCRRLGFTGGACVGDKCKCDILMEIEAMIEAMQKPRRRTSACSPQKCEQNCRKTEFNDGHCVDGRCRCETLNEPKLEGEIESHHLHRREASDCEYDKCDRLCRRVRYDSGVCVRDRCKCDILFPIEGSIIPTDLGGSCTARKCGNFCGSIGFSGSECVGTKCKCEILLQKEDNDIPPLDQDIDIGSL